METKTKTKFQVGDFIIYLNDWVTLGIVVGYSWSGNYRILWVRSGTICTQTVGYIEDEYRKVESK